MFGIAFLYKAFLYKVLNLLWDFSKNGKVIPPILQHSPCSQLPKKDNFGLKKDNYPKGYYKGIVITEKLL